MLKPLDVPTFRARVKAYRQLAGKTQEVLAAQLGMSSALLSRKLNAVTGFKLTHFEVKSIVTVLAEWQAITTQTEAIELLELMQLKMSSFTEQEWNTQPLCLLDTTLPRRSNNTEVVTKLIPKVVAVPKPQTLSNLPAQVTTLVGRKPELDHIRSFLQRSDVRLVTLSGPGGVGKTRLAVHLGNSLVADYPDGVVFVALSMITSPTLVLATIAETLDIKQTANITLFETLKEWFSDKRLLLILDNFEHLLPAASQIGELLAVAPQLKIIVTSQAVLRIYGEHEFNVVPLAIPDVGAVEPAALAQIASVELFVQRACAVKYNFALNAENASSIAQICQRLDGLPLAIELAAARSKLFSPQVLLTRLEKRFEILKGGPRNSPARHQALWDTIDWSYELLTIPEKNLFERFAVFAGEASLEAVKAVCQPDDDASEETLAALLDKSIVQQTSTERFSILESLRNYALEKLKAAQTLDIFREKHFDYYYNLAKEFAVDSWLADNTKELDTLETELNNIRLAFDWLYDPTTCTLVKVEKGLQFAVNLQVFWYLRGYPNEGLTYLTFALDYLTENHSTLLNTAVHAQALLGLSKLNGFLGNDPLGLDYAEQSLTIYQGLNDYSNSAVVLQQLAILNFISHKIETAETFLEQAVGLNKRLDDYVNLADNYDLMGNIAIKKNNFQEAEHYLQDSVTMLRSSTSSRTKFARVLMSLAQLYFYKGDHNKSIVLLEDTLEISKEVHHKHLIGIVLHNLGYINFNHKNYNEAEKYLSESIQWLGKVNRSIIEDNYELLGKIALIHKEYSKALKYFQTILHISQQKNEKRRIAQSLLGIGEVYYYLANYSEALSNFENAIKIYEQIEHNEGFSIALIWQAQVKLAEFEFEATAVLLNTLQDKLQREKFDLPPEYTQQYTETLIKVRQHLGDLEFERIFTTLELDKTVPLI